MFLGVFAPPRQIWFLPEAQHRAEEALSAAVSGFRGGADLANGPSQPGEDEKREWIENGVALGWLIDADRRTVYAYRPAEAPRELVDVDHIIGDGPVAGFRYLAGIVNRL